MGGEKDDTLVIAGVRLAGRSANRPRTESLILRSNPLMSSINLFIRNSFFRSRGVQMRSGCLEKPVKKAAL
jgi:hypothetical protein